MPHQNVLRALLIAAAIPALVRGVRMPAPRFVAPASYTTVDPEPQFTSEFLPAVPTKFVHCATLAQMASGDLAAAWYGGEDEIRPDVAIFLTIQDHRTGRWSPPVVIENRTIAARSLDIPVKTVGNPVLFADNHGLLLYFVVVMAGGWSGSTICVTSSDDGVTWSPARRVITSPFLDTGMLVRGAPAEYQDGTIALPIYHEFGGKWAALARVDRDGNVLDESIVEDRRPVMQPWLVVSGPRSAMMLMRYSSTHPYCVTLTRTADGGAQWSSPFGTPLVHRDSGLAGVRLDDGSLLVVWNNSAWDRRDLSMARSADGGIHWSAVYALERDTSSDPKIRHEYSYPFAIRTRDGRIHVVYTWQRTRIRHLVFNSAWVQADPKLAVTR